MFNIAWIIFIISKDCPCIQKEKIMGFFDVLFGLPEDNKKKKKDWIEDINWTSKYPDAFDDGFGADYEDNGFNKFDDEDSNW
ncbi:MAG: hypothetical protein IJ748_07365 [Bacteroidales bacterium]|nr:hypothetical protein [Bacteroidales bacterium]